MQSFFSGQKIESFSNADISMIIVQVVFFFLRPFHLDWVSGATN